MKNDLIFYQLFEKETSTYTYLLGDRKSKEAIIIDPVLEMIDRDMKLIEQNDLKLKYILDTHVHADHITASGEMKKRTGAKIGLSRDSGVTGVDIALEDGHKVSFGDHSLTCLLTPGHTNSCISYHLYDFVFTGDALLINGCGRTDFQQGDSEKLFHSVREKIFALDEETVVYPGHDYKGFTNSFIQQEKKFNSRLNLTISLNEFKEIMKNLNLPYPKKIDEAVPANLKLGLK